MRVTRFCLPAMVVGLVAQAAMAQRPGTSVQLPTFSYFGIGTSVSVPDRGSASLGGVSRAQGDLSQFGAPLLPFGNRSMGSSRGASGAQVSVWIHDFEAMDEALLSQSSYYQNYVNSLRPRKPDGWPSNLAGVQGDSGGLPAPSVEDIRRQRAEQQEVRANEAVTFFERGRKAEQEGKVNVARIYYQMVARRASGDLKDQALARLDALRSGKGSVADTRP
jgi:hypothetical protein